MTHLPHIVILLSLFAFAGRVASAQTLEQPSTRSSCEVVVPYSTLRKSTKSTGAADRFSAEPNDELTYGYHVVDSCKGDAPQILTTIEYPDEQTALRRFREMFNSSVTLRVSIHGWRTQHDAAVIRNAERARNAGSAAPFFVYSWPSESGYLKVQDDGPYFSSKLNRFIKSLLKLAHEIGARLEIECHSLSCSHALLALESASSWGDDQRLLHRIEHLIMGAPDVSRRTLLERLPGARKNLDFRLTIYCTSKDWAFWLKSKLGTDIMIGGDCPEIDMGPRTEVIDVSAVLAFKSLNHDYFFQNSAIQIDRDWATGSRMQANPMRSDMGSLGATRWFKLIPPS
jgi:esterase/lipase superfamily enzyme